MNLDECVVIAKPHSSNERRDIFDLVGDDFPEARQVHVFQFKELSRPNVGGNHWHNATEKFLIAAGEMSLLVLEDIDSHEKKVWQHLGPGTMITIPPRVAHANVLTPTLILVGVLDLPFDPNDFQQYHLIRADGSVI